MLEQEGVDKSWEFSLVMFGFGVTNEKIDFEFEQFDLKLNIRNVHFLFFKRVIIKYKRVFKE
jgi:hypothetical protein